MSGAAIAALIAAGAFVLLVLLLAFPLLKLGRTLDEATLAVRKTHEGAAPILTEAQSTVLQLNAQLGQLESIAANVNSMTTNVAAMTSVVSSTLGSPMIKAAAFTYGVRKTVSDRRDADAVKAARRKRRSARHGKSLMRRLFWLAMGITIGALVVRKLSRAAEKLTPSGLAAGIGQGLSDLADSISEFAADVREAMSERETQLRESTGLDGSARREAPPA